jgi:hypothetical protein
MSKSKEGIDYRGKKVAWGKVRTTKLKNWITAEYSTKVPSVKKSTTILVYPDKPYSNYKVWIGKTDGSDEGQYYSFKTKKEAMERARELRGTKL